MVLVILFVIKLLSQINIFKYFQYFCRIPSHVWFCSFLAILRLYKTSTIKTVTIFLLFYFDSCPFAELLEQNSNYLGNIEQVLGKLLEKGTQRTLSLRKATSCISPACFFTLNNVSKGGMKWQYN